jgi:hypothetical protein
MRPHERRSFGFAIAAAVAIEVIAGFAIASAVCGAMP